VKMLSNPLMYDAVWIKGPQSLAARYDNMASR
jgi:hypothetical protein